MAKQQDGKKEKKKKEKEKRKKKERKICSVTEYNFCNCFHQSCTCFHTIVGCAHYYYHYFTKMNVYMYFGKIIQYSGTVVSNTYKVLITECTYVTHKTIVFFNSTDQQKLELRSLLPCGLYFLCLETREV